MSITKFYGIVILLLAFSGCEYVVVPLAVDCSQSDLALELTATIGTTCTTSNGSITVMGIGGAGNYQYKIEGGTYQASGTLSGLAAGIYNVIVMDDIGCEATISAPVNATDGINITNMTVVDAGCGTTNGSISISVDSTSPTVTYQINGGAFGASSSFTSLAPGQYIVGVKDAGGCVTSAVALIKSGIPFASIRAIMDTNCTLSSCHVAGARSPDLTVDANVVAFADKIKAQTESKRMPQKSSGKSLTAKEIADIACWVDDGASLN